MGGCFEHRNRDAAIVGLEVCGEAGDGRHATGSRAALLEEPAVREEYIHGRSCCDDPADGRGTSSTALAPAPRLGLIFAESERRVGKETERAWRRTMKVTVLLCTYDRCQCLARALESVAASKLPDGIDWEVLVVDNNSHDQTREVVQQYCRADETRFRYLLERQQGKSYALNAGIREARGDTVAFMDDDVIVEPTWLQNLTAGIQNGEWVGAGGRILPEQGFSPPRWLALSGRYSMGGVLALFDRGDKPGQLDWAPYGANMAFRRDMFEKYGGFRTDLGPPPSELRGEDTDFGHRLMSAGERLWYEPLAIAYHRMPENRIRKDYFLAWWFGFGRVSVRKWGRGRDVLGIQRGYLSILKTAAATMVTIMPRWVLASKPEQRFFYKALIWRKAGEIYEFYRLARQRA